MGTSEMRRLDRAEARIGALEERAEHPLMTVVHEAGPFPVPANTSVRLRINQVVQIIGGEVDGVPTNAENYRERLRQLVAVEAKMDGDGDEGPVVLDDADGLPYIPEPCSDECAAWRVKKTLHDYHLRGCPLRLVKLNSQ